MLPASPCSSVPGSKIFTFPPPLFGLPGARRPLFFAPRSPLALVAPFRGAKSSHSRRHFSPSQAAGGFLSLLPSPREPLWLRFGEQNFHIPTGTFRPSGRPAVSPLCSPLPANPYASVPGSKIFTLPPPVFTLPRARRSPLFAPRSPRALVAPFRGAKSSHFRRHFLPSRATGGLLSLLPAPREPLCLRPWEQNLHITTGAFRLPQQPASHSNRKRVARAPASTDSSSVPSPS